MFTSPYRLDLQSSPPSLLSNGYRAALFAGLKRPKREANNSAATSTAIEMHVYASTPPYAS
jgi:hypothetical protein